MVLIFFFKQKTAYEMRISDWSSDVCSSDLVSADNSRRPREGGGRRRFTRRRRNKPPAAPAFAGATSYAISAPHPKTAARDHHRLVPSCLNLATRPVRSHIRSEERRVGKECVSQCRSRRSTNN